MAGIVFFQDIGAVAAGSFAYLQEHRTFLFKRLHGCLKRFLNRIKHHAFGKPYAVSPQGEGGDQFPKAAF
jgi:hypothetical protein